MNILIITASFPYPLNSGGNQAQFNMIDKLRSRVNFSLLYFRKYSFLEDEKILKDLWPEVRFYPIDIPILPKKNCLQKAVNKLWKLIYKPQKRVLNIEYDIENLTNPEIRVFLWDSLGGMTPYADIIVNP